MRERTIATTLAVLVASVAVGTATAPAADAAAAPNVPKGTGPVRNGTMLNFALTDRLGVSVNVGSGNLLVRTVDVVLPGINGNVVLGAAYNSLLLGSGAANGSLGPGWRTRSGVDVRLLPADDGTVTFLAADGVAGAFTPAGTGYNTPAEFKATLAHNGTGWKLTEHGTGRALFFTAAGILDRVEDRNHNVIDFSYDASNRMTTVVSDRDTATVRTAHVAYGSNGLISSYHQDGDDGTSRIVTYGYTGTNLTSIQAPSGRAVQFEYDGSANLSVIVTPTARTTIGYDGSHRVTSLTRLNDPAFGANSTTRLSYPSTTQTLVADANTDQSQPVASVPHTTYTVDANKRVTRAVDPAGNPRSASYTSFLDVASATDGEGGLTSNTFGANGGESQTASMSPTGAGVSFAYANPATSTNPTANFQPSSGVDPQGNAIAYTYNGAGNRLSTKDASAATAKVDYNTDGTVKASTDPANGTNATTYSYDANHQLTAIRPPTGNGLAERDFFHEAYGRLETVADECGTNYRYDKDDRVTEVSYDCNGEAPVDYTYDGSGNVTRRTDGTGTTTYSYDRLNRLIGRTSTSGGGTLTYRYDPVGNLTSLADGRGTTTYSYDTRNLLTSMTTTGGTRYLFSYDKNGRRTQTLFNANSTGTTWTAKTVVSYDKSGRMTRTTTTRNSSSPATVFDLSYCYRRGAACDGADTGLRQSQTDQISHVTSVFSYDTGNRLTRATNVNGHTYDYTYDADGNRLTSTVDGSRQQTFTYNSANQLTGTADTFVYNAAGGQEHTNIPEHLHYFYTAAQQLDEVESPPGERDIAKTYRYAGVDQAELVTGGTQSFVYGRPDQNGLPSLQSYTNGSATTYVERDGLGTPLGTRTSGSDAYLVLDGLGSVVAVVAANGSVAASYAYDPYGLATSVSEAGLAQPNPIRFAGGTYDDFAKLTKFGRRWYSAYLGRFTTQDPIATLADPHRGNRYAYAGDNPVNFVDPTGADFWDVLQTGADLFATAASAYTGAELGEFFGTLLLTPVLGPAAPIVGATIGAVTAVSLEKAGAGLGDMGA